jgi:hypothetical protein
MSYQCLSKVYFIFVYFLVGLGGVFLVRSDGQER